MDSYESSSGQSIKDGLLGLLQNQPDDEQQPTTLCVWCKFERNKANSLQTCEQSRSVRLAGVHRNALRSNWRDRQVRCLRTGTGMHTPARTDRLSAHVFHLHYWVSASFFFFQFLSLSRNIKTALYRKVVHKKPHCELVSRIMRYWR